MNGETLFALTYDVETVVPIEIELSNFCIETFEEERNNQAMRIELDLIDEKRTDTITRLSAQKRKIERCYNSKIKL